MGEEPVDLGFGHIGRMADIVEEDEPFYPVAIGLFRTTAVMAGPQRFAKTIEQFWGPDGISGFLFRDEDDFLSCL
jgi:hypothetical protein